MDIHELILESEIFDAWFNIHYEFRDKNICNTQNKNKLKELIITRILLAVIHDNKDIIDLSGILTLRKKEIHIPMEIIALIKLIL